MLLFLTGAGILWLYFFPMYFLLLSTTVHAEHYLNCDPLQQMHKDEQKCLKEIEQNKNVTTEGCQNMWDMFLCWPSALVGETISSPCPSAFIHYMKQPGSVSRNCTVRGWSAPFPLYNISCAIDDVGLLTEKQNQYRTMKVIYTVGYGTSVVTLAVAVVILVYFRRLRCARNYIHIQLFVTFILKAISIFIKDGILFPEKVLDPCMPPTASCKASITFCHYCVMTNFFWLLVEALYLNSLLMASFPHGKKYFWWFVLLGWGSPTVLIIAWILTKLYLENTGCWDHEWQSPYWWIIKGPITASIATNFLLFANIIRILFKKLDPRKINFNNSFQYRRLSKSTLLLIPLFGTHYIVFNFLPEYIHVEGRLYLELCLGSFQGFMVAVLYCFLNQEVQAEITRKWQRMHINSYGLVPFTAKDSQRTLRSSLGGMKISTSEC
uniref:Growth hormone-releasing hormone receptor n=1 Tax=Protopterus dolloi TaxID=27779 RepID=J7FEQ4_PRODO|nr:growth hormone-releasing hormone receptor [Protopterus dolloi]